MGIIVILDEATARRFEHALAVDQLRELAKQFLAEGLSPVAILDIFLQFQVSLQSTNNRQADEDRLCDVMDSMVGWCHPQCWLFDPPITNQELEAYRNEIGLGGSY